jgi:putative heme-binding domain-containing protein
VANRFGRRDLLLSILEPSRVVDEKYRNEQVITSDGRVLVGRIVTGGDYRATTLRLATDPLRPSQTVEVNKSDIEAHQASPQSPMPAGLLDTLTVNEIQDLLAFLEHGMEKSGE